MPDDAGEHPVDHLSQLAGMLQHLLALCCIFPGLSEQPLVVF